MSRRKPPVHDSLQGTYQQAKDGFKAWEERRRQKGLVPPKKAPFNRWSKYTGKPE